VSTSMSSITEPSGYVLEQLREGADFTVYRGRQCGSLTPVLAVALAAERPSPQGLRRLEHENNLAAELDAAWAAKPLALTRHEGQTVLILKDPGGEPLDLVLERNKGQTLDQARLLRVAISLANVLGHVHRQGLIHKDIKPAHVFVDGDDNVWLTGFGIASRMPHERQAPEPPEIIAGTLAYMAPEQTGRMNRSIDTRSDLYSLGITLYQMLTGHLPFDAADPLEWVHCHIARQPTPPDERGAVPEPLSAITMKLLAKNAEERYQTASGLEADLRRCLAQWQSDGRIDAFPLGAHDASDRLLIPEKLYGREGEIDVLLAAFDRVVTHGTPELVLVSGYAGVGKSSVVNELHKALVPPRGLFASGKFDQYKRDIPYATLAQAFQTLIRQILVKNEAEVERWRGSLQEAIGPNGQLIVNLIPELEFIIGKQPPAAELPPRDAQNRFQLVFRRFLGAFARKEHPLALFLDDLQWMDAASLELLEYLVTNSETQHLMMVGAYRDNEVGAAHPLMRTLEAIRKAGARPEEIVLAPLGIDDVGRLVADALHCEADSSHPLAKLVHEKTGGNPFFAIQFLTALAEEGLLRLDPDAGAWVWDLARIRARGYTDNVADLMVGKLQRLSDATQFALQQLACLGNVIEFATLALISGESEDQIHSSLLEAARTGLIVRLEGSYEFLHDRVQEAAYALIPEEERAGAHLRIGRVLLDSMSGDQFDEHLFDVANQLNRGAALLIDRDEKSKVSTIDLRAGRKAKASGAFASASAYFSSGMALLKENDWSNQHELTFTLWRERAECEILSGNFVKAEQLILELLERGASNVEFADASCLKIYLHTLKAEYPQAVESTLTCLRRFGIDLPAHPTWEQVQTEYETVWQTLGERPIESLIDLPLMSDPQLQAAMQVLSALVVPAYHADFQSFCVLACRMVKVNIQHGVSGPAAHANATLAFILGPVFHRYDLGYRFAKLACDLVDKHGFIAYKAKVYHAMGLAAFWTQPIAVAIDSMRTTSRTAIETGDLSFAVAGMDNLVKGLLSRNDPLDVVWRESEVALNFAREAKDGNVNILRRQQRFIATLQGRTDTFSTFSEAQFDEAAFEEQLTADGSAARICTYSILKLKTRFLSGDYAEALASANKAEPLLSTAIADFWGQLDFYYYAALTVAALFEKASDDEQIGWRELLAARREQLSEWAENYPPTFADKHALVSAEIARLEGRSFDAMQLYEQAIQSAREHGFVQNEALAHEVAARFYLARGFETIAHTYLRNARNCYDRWGAHGKVKQLDERDPRLHEERDSTSPTATIGTRVAQLDVEAVVKASQALSSEMFLNKLIEKLMRLALEQAGAERGLLILLSRDDEPRIEAEATTGSGRVEVAVRQAAVMPSDLPQSALHYVIRTRERVALDDALAGNLYSEDEYVRQKRPRSVLCLPIVKQTKLVGALYFENNLTPRAFTPDRVAVLELLASQAAISLENASLYSELQGSEEKIRQSERELRQIVDFAPQQVAVLGPDRTRLYANQATLDYCGLTLEEWLNGDPGKFTHPEDRERVAREVQIEFSNGVPYEAEVRFLRKDGRYRWFLFRWNPLRDEQGRVVRWYVAATDIEDRKEAEQRLQNENVALREEIDKASMFEQIVGTSLPLRNVLSRVSKVAPTDSSVLITGETGTGKELVARAIHKRSRRSLRAFVSVNCAAIPHDLIASELFGHEKGAFTGATGRRLGRFELAEGGTIFLDEVGELPGETQIALLRVLQEREFERVGAAGSIRTDVRVIAATNRDLDAAIAAGTFRSDLFYRLNVFPIEMPSLRERREDIPVLVEYFIDRFARQAGKSFQTVNKKSLDLLQSYPWPGNIRELQNVIERSVIVCETQNFSVDESWLSRRPPVTVPSRGLEPLRKLPSQEKEIIEAALSESGGRVYGPSGAAAKLGIPRSTLEHKIRSLKINKNRFKTSPHSRND
jgi:PAS domain S-box-containing protein